MCTPSSRGSDVDGTMLGLDNDGNLDAHEALLGHRNEGTYRTADLHDEPRKQRDNVKLLDEKNE